MPWPLIWLGAGAVLFLVGAIAFFRPVPVLANRWRAAGLVVAGLIVAAAPLVWRQDGWCGCQLPPVPNILAMHFGVKSLGAGRYAEAKSAFDDLVKDWHSEAIRGAAIYGRALSEEKLGEIAAAQKDFAAAAAYNPSGAMQFKGFGP
jgi:tetratricopeptide (TPR) repeat protein